jgi:hypothetical protein
MKVFWVVFLVAFWCIQTQDIIPGYLEALVGYDLRNASSKSFNERAKSQLFVDTYDDDQTFQRSKDPRKYRVPDQLTAFALSRHKSESMTAFSRELIEFEDIQASSFSIGIGFQIENFGVEASFTRTQGYIHHLFEDKAHYGASGQERREVTQLSVGPFVLFKYKKWLQEMLDSIPSCPRTENDLYKVSVFIDAYGHVFPTSITLGGTYDIMTRVDSYLVQKYDLSWISTQVSLSFYYLDFDLNAGGFNKKEDIIRNETFLKNSESHVFFEGGQNQSNATLKEWFDSLIDFPSIVGGTFRPTSDLVTNDARKRKVLEAMISEHAKTGKISLPTCASRFTSLQVPPIPGYEHLGSFDSLSLETKFRLFLFSFAELTWSNPNYPNHTFAVPENTAVWNTPDHVELNSTYFAMDEENYQYELTTRVQFSNSWFWGCGGSGSSELYVYSHYFHSNKEVMNEVTRWIRWYDLEIKPDVRLHFNNYLDSYAKKMLLRLPRTLKTTTDEQKYLEYFTIYGDHVVTRVSMGCRIHQKIYIRQEILDQMTYTKFHSESQSSFFGIFGTRQQFDEITLRLSHFMLNEVRFEVKIEGGNQELLPHNYGTKLANGFTSFTLADLKAPIIDWNAYVLTCKDFPQPIKYHATPIYEFIMDPDVSENMKIMVQKRIAQRRPEKKISLSDF